jgi:hypothetical protein
MQPIVIREKKMWTCLEMEQWELVRGALADTATATGSVPQSTQTRPGVSVATRTNNPEKLPYANGMFLYRLGADNTKSRFMIYGYVMLPTAADVENIQAKEYDFDQIATLNGVKRNFDWGFQWDFAGMGLFRVWNPTAKAWQSTPIKSPRWSPATWVAFCFRIHRDAASIYYDSVRINGVLSPLSDGEMETFTYPAPITTDSEIINFGEQGDGEEGGLPFTWCLEGYTVVAS